MEKVSLTYDDILELLLSDSIILKAKMDVLLETNALILAKLNNTELDIERSKMHEQVLALKETYISYLKSSKD